MYTRILNIWSNFRVSFWFIPTLLLIGSILAAGGMIFVDHSIGTYLVDLYPPLKMSPDSARSILSSIVAAMVSTTGVVFSITIVALSLSSSHFGSRLIRTYRKRHTTHFTLGIFVSTSLFCIIVLASIRDQESVKFVPTASVLIGIILSTLCLTTLVYYIHDMSRAIEAPNVIQSSANDLTDAVKRLFPETLGKDPSDSASEPPKLPSSADFDVLSDQTGYLQAVENETVMAIAKDNDVTIKLMIRPGDFVFEKVVIAQVLGAQSNPAQSKTKNDDDLKQKISKAISKSMIVGPERTHIQDIRHAFNEVVDIAVRALSPGINDPFTAINCVDRILAGLALLQDRTIPQANRFDEEGNLRVIATPIGLEECIQGSLGMIYNYAADSPTVMRRVEEATEILESRSNVTTLNNQRSN
ncbi:MAG: DUF2254 domain-containing protein [Planctomycetota bacterium]